MIRIVQAEVHRAISWRWLTAVAGVIFAICFDSWNDLIQGLAYGTGYVHYFFWNSSWGGVCRSYFLPMFAALPFALSFCEEYGDNVLPYIVFRENRRQYCITKYVINALCGGLVAATGTALLLAFLTICFPIVDESYYAGGIVVADRFHMWLALTHPFQYCLVETASGFLRGALWSSVALCVSVYLPDSLVVLASPYIGSFLYVQTCRMMRIPDSWRLDKLLTGNMIIESSEHTLFVCMLSVSVLLLIVYRLFSRGIWRRI